MPVRLCDEYLPGGEGRNQQLIERTLLRSRATESEVTIITPIVVIMGSATAPQTICSRDSGYTSCVHQLAVVGFRFSFQQLLLIILTICCR